MNAEAFCNGTDIQTLKCDWAGDAEQNKVASGTFAGTMWTAEPKPPQTLSGGGRSYFQVGCCGMGGWRSGPVLSSVL